MSPCSSLIAFLIVLHLLLCRAYGARVGVFDIKSPTSIVQQSYSENNNNNDITKKDGANKDNLGRGKVEVACADEEHCTSKGTLLIKRRRSRVAYEDSHHHYHDDDHDHHHHHWLPWIYEDYHGPKRHVPRHH